MSAARAAEDRVSEFPSARARSTMPRARGAMALGATLLALSQCGRWGYDGSPQALLPDVLLDTADAGGPAPLDAGRPVPGDAGGTPCVGCAVDAGPPAPCTDCGDAGAPPACPGAPLGSTCGGACGPTCAEGQPCNVVGDCARGSCVDGSCNACPDDVDGDLDGTCDARDLEQRAYVPGANHGSLSPDATTLFARSLDASELRAYRVESVPSVTPSLLASLTLPDAATHYLRAVYAMGSTRVAVSIAELATSDITILRVYELQGSSLELVEDITTTSNRIYDVQYDDASDRLYWSSFEDPAVHYYELASTPLGFSGFGTSPLPFNQLGGYAMRFEGNLLIKTSIAVEVGDLSTGAVVAAWTIIDNVGSAVGQNSIGVYRETLLYTTYFDGNVSLIAEDISALPAHALVTRVELAPTASVEAHFVVRTTAPVALVSTAGQPLRVFDLSALPAALPASVELPPSVLGGEASGGFMDCGPSSCFVSAASGIYVLAP